MAVEPLYNEKATLIAKLRLTDTSDTDTLTLIDQAITDVRLGFYRRLTSARALQIAGYTSVENPTTDEGILRATADNTEVYWVIYKLICILPTMFIETQYAIKNSFDDVPITRDSESLQKFRDCLWNSIEKGLADLESPKDDAPAGAYQSFCVGRVDSNGDSDPFILDDEFIGLPRD